MTIDKAALDRWITREPDEELIECPECNEEVAIGTECECGWEAEQNDDPDYDDDRKSREEDSLYEY